MSQPNTSILTFFLQESKDPADASRIRQKLLFIQVKPVADIFPFQHLFWYPGKGSKGMASFVWRAMKIKQYLVSGKDADILQVFDTLISSGTIDIDGTPFNIDIPAFTITPFDQSMASKRSEEAADKYILADPNWLPQQFLQKENLEQLSGYKESQARISAAEPPGFFGETFLHHYLNRNCFGFRGVRLPYLTFRGERKSAVKGKGPIKMLGFYQKYFDPAKSYTAVFADEAGKTVGTASIDIDTGFFSSGLDEPVPAGTVRVLEDGTEERNISYVLLQDIQFDVNVATTTFTDAYKRTTMITPSDTPSLPPQSQTWQRDAYADPDVADANLSDLFKAVFDYLAPNILVADPYFINDIKKDGASGDLSLTHDQLVFLNGFLYSAVSGKAKSLRVLGSDSRANNHATTDDNSSATTTEQRYQKYE